MIVMQASCGASSKAAAKLLASTNPSLPPFSQVVSLVLKIVSPQSAARRSRRNLLLAVVALLETNLLQLGARCFMCGSAHTQCLPAPHVCANSLCRCVCESRSGSAAGCRGCAGASYGALDLPSAGRCSLGTPCRWGAQLPASARLCWLQVQPGPDHAVR